MRWLGEHASELLVADEAGCLVFANGAGCRWLGVEPSAVQGMCLRDIDPVLATSWSESAPQRWEPAFATIRPSWSGSDGAPAQPIEFRLQAMPLDGPRYLVLSSGRSNSGDDVEQALKHTLAFVQGVIDAFPDFLFEGNAQGRYLNAWTKNPELLAASREFLIGNTLEEVLSPENAAIARSAFEEADQRGVSFGKVISIDTQNGRRWYELSVSRMSMGEGREPHFITVSRDVTARLSLQAALEEKERQFRTLVENSPDMIARIDPQLSCMYANPAFAECTQREPQALVGLPFAQTLDEKPAAALQALLAGVFRSGQPANQELNWTDAQGRRMCCLFSLTPEPDAHEQVCSVLLVGRDIGELRAREAAEAASRAKGEFLARMSHEIRTPLNAVLGLAYLSERETLEDTTRERLRQITRAGRSLLSLINDILDFSKIEEGLLKIEQVPFDLQQVLDNIAVIMGSAAPGDEVELVVGPLPAGVRHLVGDALRIEQVLINLAGNALKFTRQGRVELSLEVIEDSADAMRLKFSVQDTGIGLSQDQIGRLFRPFTQADVSTSRRFGGTGLGLSICKRLVNLMGGEIGVHSEPGQGSRFWFTVTLGKPQAPGPAPALPAPLHLGLVVARERTRSVLVSMCEQLGWRVSLGEPGPAGGVADAVPGADVTLIDWVASSDRAGAPAARPGSAGQRSACLAVLTGMDGARELSPLLAAGELDAVLTRPVTASSLLDGVGRALHRFGRPWTAPPEGACAGGDLSLGGLRVMVVDDSDINRDLACSILRSHGAAASQAESGQQALDHLRADPLSVDAVLMDVQMPGMSGLQATQALRQLPGCAALPVVALTAAAFTEERKAALAAGMDAVVTKPFDVEELVGLLCRLTGRGAEAHTPAPLAAPAPARAPDTSGDGPWIDVDRGLLLWQDMDQYRDRLARFLSEYEHEASRADGLPTDELLARVHKARGSAASLALVAAARAARTLEGHLRSQPRDGAEVGRYVADIERTCSAIRALLGESRAG